MLRKGQQQTRDDVMTPEEEIKDPFYFEFLNLKDEYSETDLEGALIAKLETFLLELGGVDSDRSSTNRIWPHQAFGALGSARLDSPGVVAGNGERRDKPVT